LPPAVVATIQAFGHHEPETAEGDGRNGERKHRESGAQS